MDKMDSLVMMDKMEKPLVLVTMAIGGLEIKIQENPLVVSKVLQDPMVVMGKMDLLPI